MANANAVLLPKVFPTDLVSLGQLLRNPLIPNIDTYRDGCTFVSPDDVSKSDPIAPYNAIVSTDVRGRFDIGLTRYLMAKIGGQKTRLLSIDAEKLQTYELRDTGKAFRHLCESETAQSWINDMVLHKTPCYFVIGIQVIYNAEFKRAVFREGHGGGQITLPLEATATLPIHLSGGLSASEFGYSTGKKITGVFGIQVQRLDPHIRRKGELRLNDEVAWKWSYQRVKGTVQQEEEKELGVRLSDNVEVDELVELLEQDDDDDDEEDE